MDVKLKQRIVGILVILALAVIIIPMFIRHKPETSLPLSTKIPPAPAQPSLNTIPTAVPSQDTANQLTPAALPATPAPATDTNSTNNNLNQPLTFQHESSNQPQAGQTQALAIPPAPAAPPVAPANTATTPVQAVAATAPAASNSGPAASNAVNTNANIPSNYMPPASANVSQPTPKKAVKPAHKTTHTQTKSASHTHTAQKKPVAQHHAKPTPPKTHATVTHKKTATHVTTTTIKNGWSVQLGSFSDHANALGLIKKLRAHGFKVYSENINTPQGRLLRVLVGPEKTREEAEKVSQRLLKEYQLHGIISKYPK